MRTIKFRAWNEPAKRYSKSFTLKSDVLNYTDDDGLGVVKSLTDEIIEQFTGLKDKNGKDIYDGDIIREFDGVLWDVCFDKELVQWHCRCEIDSIPLYEFIEDSEVIGNIHENPELLK